MTSLKKLLVLGPIMGQFEAGPIEAMLQPFYASGYTPIVIDSLAIDSSDRAETTAIAAQLAPLVAAMQPVAAIGFSFGGAALQHLAALPVWRSRPLVLMSSPVRISSELNEKFRKVLALLASPETAALGIAAHDMAIQPNWVQDKLPKAKFEADGGLAANRICRGLTALSKHDGWASLKQSDAPVLACVGSASCLVTAVEALPPRGSVLTVSQAGMRPLHDAATEVFPYIRDFLTRNLS